jgi:hypothetical protein
MLRLVVLRRRADQRADLCRVGRARSPPAARDTRTPGFRGPAPLGGIGATCLRRRRFALPDTGWAQEQRWHALHRGATVWGGGVLRLGAHKPRACPRVAYRRSRSAVRLKAIGSRTPEPRSTRLKSTGRRSRALPGAIDPAPTRGGTLSPGPGADDPSALTACRRVIAVPGSDGSRRARRSRS